MNANTDNINAMTIEKTESMRELIREKMFSKEDLETQPVSEDTREAYLAENENTLFLDGGFVLDEFAWLFGEDEPYISPGRIRTWLQDKKGPVTLVVNSGGGMAAAGVASMEVIGSYQNADESNTVKAIGVGRVSSAATFLVLSADEFYLHPMTQFMIHEPRMPVGAGTPDDIKAAHQALEQLAQMGAAFYAEQNDMTAEETRALMKAETYYTPEAAVEAGFANGVIEMPKKKKNEESKASASENTSKDVIMKSPRERLVDANMEYMMLFPELYEQGA